MTFHALQQWIDESTGIMHLAEEDGGWMAVYCTWKTIEQRYTLEQDAVPTCVVCIAFAILDERCWTQRTET